MTNLERIQADLNNLGLLVKEVEEWTAMPLGVTFHATQDFESILATLRDNGYQVIRYVEPSYYILLAPPRDVAKAS